ncbi:SDR family oxidoreductase [Streptomyces sp. 900105755]
MKPPRVGAPGEERAAVRTEDGRLLDLSPLTSDIDGAFLASDGAARARAEVAAVSPPELDRDGLRTGDPLGRPGKIVCVGPNHRDHAAETGAAIPPRPVVFMRDPGTVSGPYDEVPIPRGSVRTYSSQWDLGKSCETFNPLGPWRVPADEVGVNPGTADTPSVTRLLDAADDPEAERAALQARQPLGRLITADEVAAAVVHLTSPAAASVTGIALAVDGGVQGPRLRPAAGS